MPGIPLQQEIVYGPILSRRLGRSFGINLMGNYQKVCSFDCVYCEYGQTGELTFSPNRDTLPSIADVLIAVEKALKKPRTIDYLTFSGNGEPTIHPDFPEIVYQVKSLVDRVRPDVKLAILSNASMVTNPDVISALERIDLPMLKLDVGTQQAFEAINRPVRGVCLDKIISGLGKIKNLVVQSVLIEGTYNNIHDSNYSDWVQVLSQLHPSAIHIYSTERPTAMNNIECVSPEILKSIENDLRLNYGLHCTAYWQSS